MKKFTFYLLFCVASFLSSVAIAAECGDLNGVWQGQLGEVQVILNIDIQGYSSFEYYTPTDHYFKSEMKSTCTINNGVPTILITHFVNVPEAKWQIMVNGQNERPNELMTSFQASFQSGSSPARHLSGTGILNKQ